MSTADKLKICRDTYQLCLAMLEWTENRGYWKEQADIWADRINRLESLS